MFSALAAAAVAMAVVELPASVPLKTPTRAFSRRYDFALDDGRIYWKLRQPEQGAPPPVWAKMGPDGLPFRQGGKAAGDPTRIIEISADSSGLVAVGEDLRIYDADIQDIARGHFFWNYVWGFPWRILPDKVSMPKDRRAWTYSLLNIAARFSEDVDGNPHTIIGVDSVFVLAPDGRSLMFDDPWLPPNAFEFRVSVPERGAYAGVNISASGSTVMLIDRRGRIYTRLVDFDSLGGNPGITYSYERLQRGYTSTGLWALARGLFPMVLDVRSLPPEPWRRQPEVPGPITRIISVLQTGDGNAARELRVEGTDASGDTGVWFKPVSADQWEFRKTGHAITEPFLDPQAPPEVQGSTDERCDGQAEFDRRAGELGAPTPARFGFGEGSYGARSRVRVPASLTGFNPGWDPARINVPSGSSAYVTLHLRPYSFPIRKGQSVRLPGTLELPTLDSSASRAEADLTHQLRALLGGRTLTPVFVHVDDREVRVEADEFGTGDRAFSMRFARQP